MNYGSDASGTHLVSSFWYFNSSLADGEFRVEKYEKGCASLLNYHSKYQTAELYEILHADLFISDKMLINGVDMNFGITRAPETYISWDLQTIQMNASRSETVFYLSLKSK